MANRLIQSVARFLARLLSTNDDATDQQLQAERKTRRHPQSSVKRVLNLKVCRRKMRTTQREEKQESREVEDERIEVMNDLASIRHETADLVCPICLKFICVATCAGCGHCYCYVCIQEYFLFAAVVSSDEGLFDLQATNQEQTVDVCLQKPRQHHRASYQKHGRCFGIAGLPFSNEGGSQLLDGKEVVSHDSRAQVIEVGKKIDVRSPDYVWCVGIIKKIIYKQDKNLKQIIIHYEVEARSQRGFPASTTSPYLSHP